MIECIESVAANEGDIAGVLDTDVVACAIVDVEDVTRFQDLQASQVDPRDR